jgi:hypothetical protein
MVQWVKEDGESESLIVIVGIRVETSPGMKMSPLPSGLEW